MRGTLNCIVAMSLIVNGEEARDLFAMKSVSQNFIELSLSIIIAEY